MKIKNVIPLIMFLVGAILASPTFAAQPTGSPFGGFVVPTITSATDVAIGSFTTGLSTDDGFQTFLRFRAPSAEIDIEIEGIDSWRKDPRGILWEIVNGVPIHVNDDDDSGPWRDFLIRHRLRPNRTYVLQIGSYRDSSVAAVRISSKQIVLDGQNGSQSLLANEGPTSRTAIATGAELLQSFGRSQSPSWNLGNDFGTCINFWGRTTRTFSVRSFALPSDFVSVTGVSISSVKDPFRLRNDVFPANHVDSFEASLLPNGSIEVTFNPKTGGVINGLLQVDYTIRGRAVRALLPLIGRGSSGFAFSSQVVPVTSGNRLYKKFTTSNEREFTSGQDPHWIGLNFEVPVDDVIVYVLSKNRSLKVNASLFVPGDGLADQQLLDSGFYSFGQFSLRGNRRADLRIMIPTEVAGGFHEYDVYVFAGASR